MEDQLVKKSATMNCAPMLNGNIFVVLSLGREIADAGIQKGKAP